MAGDAEDRTLTYERAPAAFASRRQFRILLVLLLLNFAVTLQTAYVPQLRDDLRSWWAGYQDKRQARALQEQAMRFNEPASKVVWDENPDTAAALLNTPGYGRIHIDRRGEETLLAHWPSGARALIPSAADLWSIKNCRYGFPNLAGREVVEPDECALLLLHGLKSPSGQERLVYAYVKGKILARNLRFPNDRNEPQLGRQWSSSATRELTLVAASCTTDADGHASVSEDDVSRLEIYPPNDRQDVKFTWTPPAGKNPEQIHLDSGPRFRFYAGVPDPANPSQFTIGYDVDQQHGTIHGSIAPDGPVVLKPDTGAMLGNRWYPTGLPSAATK